MIDHITFRVSDVEKSREFYEKTFAPLGYKISFGKDGVFHAFDIKDGLFEIMQSEDEKVLTKTHIALRVKDKQAVDSFFKAGLEAGGKDNGKPGPRPEYTETYYAAFVLDPDGHNIEAMFDK